MAKKIKITEYNIKADSEKLFPEGAERTTVRLALVSDVHGKSYDALCAALREAAPDAILAPGDIIEHKHEGFPLGIPFLAEATRIAPLYYSTGNHEKVLSDDEKNLLAQSGIHLVNETEELLRVRGATLRVGGIPSAPVSGTEGSTTPFNLLSRGDIPSERISVNKEFLKRFAAEGGYKLLLCHNPEYYPKFIKELDIDLTVSGHTHGGQVILFGHGLFAPGQGFFPKYDFGAFDNRLVISRGVANNTYVPRIFNRAELVIINLIPV